MQNETMVQRYSSKVKRSDDYREPEPLAQIVARAGFRGSLLIDYASRRPHKAAAARTIVRQILTCTGQLELFEQARVDPQTILALSTAVKQKKPGRPWLFGPRTAGRR